MIRHTVFLSAVVRPQVELLCLGLDPNIQEGCWQVRATCEEKQHWSKIWKARPGKLERGGSIHYRDEKPKENHLPNR